MTARNCSPTPAEQSWNTGAANPSAKLSVADVRNVRRLHAAGMSLRGIAEKYGVSHETIRLSVLGRTWRSVGK